MKMLFYWFPCIDFVEVYSYKEKWKMRSYKSCRNRHELLKTANWKFYNKNFAAQPNCCTCLKQMKAHYPLTFHLSAIYLWTHLLHPQVCNITNMSANCFTNHHLFYFQASCYYYHYFLSTQMFHSSSDALAWGSIVCSPCEPVCFIV